MKSSNKIANFESLENLREFLKNLESSIREGEIKSSDVDFIPIFKTIQKLVDQKTLETIVGDLEVSSELFSQKITEIQGYINKIAFDDSFKTFLLRHKDNDPLLRNILTKCWKVPVVFEEVSHNFLTESFNRWAGRKISRKKMEYIIPEKTDFIPEFSINSLPEPFQESLNDFFDYIKKEMPIKLLELLMKAKDADTFYNWFNYCLHLITKHKIHYDKTNGIIKEVNNT
jgi:hypothetical protein